MIQFLVHDDTDSVGVATQDLKSGDTVTGLYQASKQKLELKALDDIPLGHKIALQDHSSGDGVIKYGHDIGKVVADIKKGGHVHVHNLKTRRW